VIFVPEKVTWSCTGPFSVSTVVVVTTFVPDDPEDEDDEEDVEGAGVVAWTVEDSADGW
jgi:hypothetical protein